MAQRAGDAGVREWASLAILDAIDFVEELGVMWDDEAGRRRPAADAPALGLRPAVDSVEAVPDRLMESYDRLLLALEQLLQEAQRAGDPGVREWASRAMLDAIEFAEERGMMWDDEAGRRRVAVREAFGDLGQRQREVCE